jgi:C-terminal processing protease CtpA/Prc
MKVPEGVEESDGHGSLTDSSVIITTAPPMDRGRESGSMSRSASLSAAAQGSATAVIVVSDNTRQLAADAMLFEPPKDDELLGSPRHIGLTRHDGKLGISVIGDTEDKGCIFIAKLAAHAMEKTGLHRGMRILSVDGEDVRNATHGEALAAFSRGGDTVDLEVEDDPAGFFTFLERNDTLPESSRHVTLHRRDATTEPWGVRMSAGTASGPVFITHVLPDSPAADAGQLYPGDRVLAINGEDTTEASQGHVAELIAHQPEDLVLQVERDENEWAMTRAQIRERARSEPREVPVSLAEQGWQEQNALSMPEETLAVVVPRENGRFGLGLIGDKSKRGEGVYVEGVRNASAVAAGVERGMRVYMVDDSDVRWWTQPEVVELLKTAGDTVRLVVAKDDEGLNRMHEDNEEGEEGGVDRRNSVQRATALGAETAQAEEPESAESPAASHVSAKQASAPNEDGREQPTPAVRKGLMPSDSRRVELFSDNGLYGMSILADETLPGPVFVADLVPEGSAAKSGQIQKGDRIVAIGGNDTRSCLKADAVKLIKTSGQVLTLDVTAEQSLFEQLSDEIEHTRRRVVLERNERPFGISLLASQRAPAAAYISGVKAGGNAALSGRVFEGDRILSINGTPTLMLVEGKKGVGMPTNGGAGEGRGSWVRRCSRGGRGAFDTQPRYWSIPLQTMQLPLSRARLVLSSSWSPIWRTIALCSGARNSHSLTGEALLQHPSAPASPLSLRPHRRPQLHCLGLLRKLCRRRRAPPGLQF